jgi:bacillithiol biosynthesis cysteine-adding enzyme BshC
MRATPWLPFAFGDRDARLTRVRIAAERRIAPAVLEALRAAEPGLPPSAARQAHLETLARPGTACVVTGQQVGLFLGPLYTLYKAATAVVLARTLSVESGVPCVPLFWLQTEDHDFAEIDHCYVPGERGVPLKLSIGGDAQERVSVAHRLLPATVVQVRAQLEAALDGLPHAPEVIAEVAAAYRPGVRMGAAFAHLLAALFADEGLLVLDPRSCELQRAAAPIYRAAIGRAAAIDDALTARGEALRAAGLSEQVATRAGACLAFFHQGDARGPRHRLERRADRWAGPAELALSDDDLFAILEQDPLRLSSSALLRPLVQDTLLPTAAYVGGPAEVSYFAQLQPLYELSGLPMPLVAPRARFRLLDGATRSLLDKLGLEAADVERPRAKLAERVLARHAGSQSPPDRLRSELLAGFQQRLDELASSTADDRQLERAVRRTRATVERAVERLVGRYARRALERDRILGERLDRLQRWLYPDSEPQERHYAPPYFYARFGRDFHRQLLAAIDPFRPEVKELVL